MTDAKATPPDSPSEKSRLGSPLSLCICRAAFGAYCLATSLFTMFRLLRAPDPCNCTLRMGLKFFGHTTTLFHFGLTGYLLFVAARALPAYVAIVPPSPFPCLRSPWAFWGTYVTVLVFPFLIVDVLAWVLFDDTSGLICGFSSSQALASAFSVFEQVVPGTRKPPYTHLALCLLMMLAYCGLTALELVGQGLGTISGLEPDVEGRTSWMRTFTIGTVTVHTLAVFFRLCEASWDIFEEVHTMNEMRTRLRTKKHEAEVRVRFTEREAREMREEMEGIREEMEQIREQRRRCKRN